MTASDINEKTSSYMHIAAQLAQVQSAHEEPLALDALFALVTQELGASQDDVVAVYWELAHRGFFDSYGRPLYSLPQS